MASMAELEKEVASVRRRLASVNVACELLQKDNLKLGKEKDSFEAQAENAERNLEIQKKIVKDHLDQSSKKESNLVSEILSLKEENKLLKKRVEELEN